MQLQSSPVTMLRSHRPDVSRFHATLERDPASRLPVINLSHMGPHQADFIWNFMVLNQDPACSGWMSSGLELRSKAGAHLTNFDREIGEASITLHGNEMDDFLLYLRDAAGITVHR